MRLGLDVTALLAGKTGVARYARMHLEELTLRGGVEVKAFAIGRGPHPGVDLRRVRVPLRVVQRGWRHLGVPRAEWLVGPVDLIHSIDIIPPSSARPLVTTVHDVLPLTLSERYAPRQRMMALEHLERAVKADLVVTTCEATAAEIATRTRVSPERLLVAPPGHRALSATFLEPSVDEPYILAVGAVTPRKGFQYLIEAVHRLGSGAPLLVLAGPDGWRANVIHKRITALGLEGRVRALGYIDDGALEGWYRRALLLCHPSEAEGFGIPVLEAMAYGVPVVATDIPPVREIGGDGILLVPPNDPGALSEAIGTLIGDDDLRGRLSVRGRSLAAPFTWSRMTDTIVEGYRHVLGSELH